MWIMLNTGFLSVVASTKEGMAKAGVEGDPKEWLSVRARKPEHIKAIFPDAAVHTWPGRDYAARAYVPRKAVEWAVREQVRQIDYANFKDSVGDRDLHDAYLEVWHSMWEYQRRQKEEVE